MSGKKAREFRLMKQAVCDLLDSTTALRKQVDDLQMRVDALHGKRRQRSFYEWILHMIGLGVVDSTPITRIENLD